MRLNHIKIDLENNLIFKKKKLLQKIYIDYFKKIKKNLLIKSKKNILEIGSSGFIKKIIPNCITSNLEIINQNIDLKENIYNLKINKNSVSNLILVDIFHHLKYPGLAFKNIDKVLIKGGRVIMIEPAMGTIPKIIFKIFHHEPIGFDLKIRWNHIPKKIPSDNSYFAAQSIPWRAFIYKEFKNIEDKFKIKRIECFSDFAFLGSGGFSYTNFYPVLFFKFIKFIDLILTKINYKIFSARMLIVLEKK